MQNDLRTAAQQALEALEELNGWQSLAPPLASDAGRQAAINLRSALAEHHCDTYCTWLDHAPGCARAEPVQEPVRGSEMRRCPRCWEPMSLPHPKLTVTDLQEALVYTNLIDRDAIDDPDNYDEGSTLAQIDALHQRLTA